MNRSPVVGITGYIAPKLTGKLQSELSPMSCLSVCPSTISEAYGVHPLMESESQTPLNLQDVVETNEDHWLSWGGFLIRVHEHMRDSLFVPTDRPYPFDYGHISSERVAVARNLNGSRAARGMPKLVSGYEANQRRCDFIWQGSTEFEIIVDDLVDERPPLEPTPWAPQPVTADKNAIRDEAETTRTRSGSPWHGSC